MLKKFNLICSVALAALFFVSCNQAEVAKLRSEKAELESNLEEIKYQASLKDSTINDFFKDFNDIEMNLMEIKKKEQGLVGRKIGKGDLPKGTKDQIISDITSINDLLAENKEKIRALNARLKKANINIDEFENMLTTMEASLEQKNLEIDELRGNLANANDALSALNDLYIESVMEAEARQEELNKAYYAFGTFKELKENNVLTKEGGLIGIGASKTLKEDFNKGYFKEINIEETSEIELFSTKAKIETNHPSESYSLDLKEGVYVLTIKNAAQFWSASKYLVIITE